MSISRQWRHITHSARGELFNFLLYPFILITFSYGLGFAFLISHHSVEESSLFIAMTHVWAPIPMIWGIIAIAVVLAGIYVLLFDKPPLGKFVAFIGFSIWLFAAMCYILTGGILTLFSVALPSMMFWAWQYFSLAEFRRQDKQDMKNGVYRSDERS